MTLCGQDSFRGLITAKQYGINKPLQTPKMNYKEGKIEMVDIDTLYHEYHVCGDTVVHFYDDGMSGSAQIKEDFYLYSGNQNYFKFTAPPSALEKANRETWSKPSRRYRKQGYNAVHRNKNKDHIHYSVLDDSITYSWQGHDQGLLNHLFHKDGLHRRYLEEWRRDIKREKLFTYAYDAEYSCDSIMTGFVIEGEADLDEMLAFNTPDYEIIPPEIRQPLAEVNAVNVNGTELDMAEYKGKFLYIDMWASWCGPCKLEMKHMKTLSESYSPNDVVFISLSVDEKDKINDWKSNIDELEMTWVNGILEGGFEDKFCDSYSIIAIPRYILVDRSGNVISHNAPRPTSDMISEWLDQLIIE